MTDRVKTATVDGTGQGTDPLSSTHQNPSAQLNFSIECSSAWSGTIALQRKRADGTWKSVRTYTDDIEEIIEDAIPGVVYRLQCTVYSAGDADLEIYK